MPLRGPCVGSCVDGCNVSACGCCASSRVHESSACRASVHRVCVVSQMQVQPCGGMRWPRARASVPPMRWSLVCRIISFRSACAGHRGSGGGVVSASDSGVWVSGATQHSFLREVTRAMHDVHLDKRNPASFRQLKKTRGRACDAMRKARSGCNGARQPQACTKEENAAPRIAAETVNRSNASA